MVRKIQSSEYLKRYDNMTADERITYLNRVGAWLNDEGRALLNKADDFDLRLQNIQSGSAGWNDAECAAFESGVVLLSAVACTCDTWLPDLLYAKSAGRCIRMIYGTLMRVRDNEKRIENGNELKLSSGQCMAEVSTAKNREDARQTDVGSGPALGMHTDEHSGGGVPPRPRHIDQYVHLLPAKTQERAGQVKDLLRELDSAREKLRLLMGSPQASPADTSAWAKKATQIDNKIKSIYDELDREWEELVKQGRVVLDSFGNASVVPSDYATGTVSNEQNGLNSEQKARRRELRKWLIDTRRGNGNSRDARIKQWYENFTEYLTLEGDIAFDDNKIAEAAKHYGIDFASLRVNV